MTHLEILLRFIKEMDSEMLLQIIPERLSQQKVSKQVFIKKLEDIFTEFKANGDSQILINDNTCKCEDCLALDFEKRSFAFFCSISGDFFCLDFYIIENKVILIDNPDVFDLDKVIEMKNDLFEFQDLTKMNNWNRLIF